MLICDLNVSLGQIFARFRLIGGGDGRIDAYIIQSATIAASGALFFTFNLQHQIRFRRLTIYKDHTFLRLQGRQVNEGRVREIARASVDIMISLPTSIGDWWARDAGGKRSVGLGDGEGSWQESPVLCREYSNSQFSSFSAII